MGTFMRRHRWVLGLAGPALLSLPLFGAEVTREGKKLEGVLNAMDVENLWLSRQIVNWKTGQPMKKATDGKAHTHCSAFVAATCLKLDIYILRPPEYSSVLLANAQYDWLQDEGAKHGWKPVRNGVEAQNLANQGDLVVAVVKESNPKKSGHIALVRPSTRSEARINEEGPLIIQAGGTNYNRTSLKEGFKHHPAAWRNQQIRYYAHRVDWK